MDPLTLRFEGGRVEGEGRDCIGRFTFAGSYTNDGKVRLVKRYVGAHAVRYDGEADGEGAIVGRWSTGPDWFGPFALTPVIDEADSALAAVEEVHV
jgi:hypothetical protein